MIKVMKKVFVQSKYVYIALITALFIFGLYYLLIRKVTTLSNMFVMGGSAYTIFSLLMLLFIAALFGINTAFFWYKKEVKLKLGLKEGIGSTAGALFGSIASGCPVCGAFLLSLVGVTSGLAIFPFKGIEIQLLSIALLGASLFLNAKSISNCDSCEVKR